MDEFFQRYLQEALLPYQDLITQLTEQIEAIQRCQRSLIRAGYCHAVDVAQAKVQVQHGANRTPWIHWFAPSAGEIREFRCPSQGERCLILNFAGGDNSCQSVALFGIFSETYPPEQIGQHLHRRIYPDGSTVTYDHQQHRLQLHVPQGEIVMSGAKHIHLDAPKITCSGTIQAEKDVFDQKRSMAMDRTIFESHQHGGVYPGTATTPPPMSQ